MIAVTIATLNLQSDLLVTCSKNMKVNACWINFSSYVFAIIVLLEASWVATEAEAG